MMHAPTADHWIPYTGPHGGHGWRNAGTGEVRYQEDSPSGHAGLGQPPQPFLPGSGLSPLVKAKIARAVPGAGRQIALSRHEVEQVLAAGLAGFVSAGRNPASHDDVLLSDQEIALRHEQLKRRLVEMGCKFVPVHGKYGAEEDSFLVMVPEVQRHELVALGREFNQDSVIYTEDGKNEMIFTTGEHAGQAHVGQGWQPMPEADDFYSEVRTADGRSFKFQLKFDFDDLVRLSRRLRQKMTMNERKLMRRAAIVLSRHGLVVPPGLRPLEFIRHVSTAARNRKVQLSRLGRWPSIRLAQGQASVWQGFTTKRGKQAWRSTVTGEKRYQPERPGEHEGHGKDGPATAPAGQAPAERPKLMTVKEGAHKAIGEVHNDDGDRVVPPNSFGIARQQMPQILKDDLPDFMETMKKHGVEIGKTEAVVGQLKPTQNEVSLKKMKSMAETQGPEVLKQPVIISNDGFILDGHHRWGALVMQDPKSTIPAWKVDLPMKELLKRSHAYSKVKYEAGGKTGEPTPNIYEPPTHDLEYETALEMVKDLDVPDKLPEEHGTYFKNLENAVMMPLDRLENTRARADGIQRGKQFMWGARKGLVGKRDPIKVVKQPDGTYKIADGNSTFANARDSGWKDIPVVEVGPEALQPHDSGAKHQETVPQFFDKEKDLPDDNPQMDVKAGSYQELEPHAHEANQQLQKLLNLGRGIGTQLGYETVLPDTDHKKLEDRLKKPGGVVMLTPIKSEKRAAEKVDAWFGGDWTKLTDAVRATVAVDSPHELQKVVEQMRKNGVEFARQPKDRMNNPLSTGYRDLVTHIKMPNGMVAEVQLHLKPMLLAKEFGGGHKHYEAIRRIEEKYNALGHRYLTNEDHHAYQEAFDKSQKTYKEAWRQAQQARAAGGQKKKRKAKQVQMSRARQLLLPWAAR